VTPRPLRLAPGEDLRSALEALLRGDKLTAAFVVAGIGSLSRAAIRFAGRARADIREGNFEIVSLSGSLSRDGAHLHAALADENGRVFGGHVAAGCVVRTTAEILVVELPGWEMSRQTDPATGYPELHITPPG
jgi:predicted DNA-binding protein with PD1-like motif